MKVFLPFLLATIPPGDPINPTSLLGQETQAWKEASTFLFNDSHAAFSKLPDQSDPEVQLGLAATLLNLQPRTPKNLESAARILERLVESTPKESETWLLARFLQARMAENYLTPPEPKKAMEIYREIVDRKPGVSLLEISASRLVLLKGFGTGSAPENLAALLELEPLSSQLSTREGLREFHLSMGFALLENDGDRTRILDHLIKADDIGFRRKENSIHNWLVIARLSEDANLPDQAARYYQKFLDRFPNDPKSFGINHRLQKLKNNGTQ